MSASEAPQLLAGYGVKTGDLSELGKRYDVVPVVVECERVGVVKIDTRVRCQVWGNEEPVIQGKMIPRVPQELHRSRSRLPNKGVPRHQLVGATAQRGEVHRS